MARKRSNSRLGNRVQTLEQLESRRLLSADGLLQSYAPFDNSEWSQPGDSALFGSFTVEQVFNLQSKPGSNYTIFLDFDGHVTEGTSWNSNYGISSIVSPPFDLDGDTTSYNQVELERIYSSWQRTAEDWAPFDVNVTTRDPGLDALMNSGGGDQTWGARAIATVDNFANCGCGGFAFLNTFDDSIDTPTFVFNLGPGSLGETFSHEVGHMVGLSHDGDSAEYYPGHGTGNTSWGPIMGAPFDENITTWNDGDYFNASNGQDDLFIMTNQNGFGYRNDDHGSTMGTATPLDAAGTSSVTAYGIIERNTDRDYFQFETAAGDVSFDIAPLAERPNLDVWAGIYDSFGNLIAESNPVGELGASFTNVSLAGGTYTLRVEGVGTNDVYNPATDNVDPPAVRPWTQNPPTGYSDYGSLGQYQINGTVVASGSDSFSLVATDAVKAEGEVGLTTLTFTVNRIGDTSGPASVDWDVVDTLPAFVGDNFPDLATSADFVGGTSFQGTLNFVGGQASQTITLDVAADTDVEYDEFFDIQLSNPSSGWQLADSRATGTILSDESVVGFPALGASDSVNEGPFDGVLLRWRQVAAASGSFDEWAIDNITISGTTFTEDFEPNIDNSLWSDISNASASSQFNNTQGNALTFTGGPDRWAITNALSLTPGEMVEFDIIFGDSSNGGENADEGEDVFLEFSTDNGSNWQSVDVFDTEDYTTWSTVQAVLPMGVDQNPPGQVDFIIGRSFGTAESATVDWAVDTTGVSNPADGDDFVGGVLPTGQVTFAPGETEKTIVIQVSADTDFEPDESFNVLLTGASGPATVVLDTDRDQGSGQILNDDASYVVDPGPQFRWRQKDNSGDNFDNWAIDNVQISNGTFSENFDPDIDLGLWDQLPGGVVNSDFGGDGNSLFFTGNFDPRMVVSNAMFAANGDTLEFDIIYGNDNNGGENPETGEEVVLEYSTDGSNWMQIAEYPLNITTWTTIQEDVPADAIRDPQVFDEGNAGSVDFTFEVMRTGNTTETSSVDWEVLGSGANPADGLDFVGGMLPSGTLEFAPGETTKSVTIQVMGDTSFEADETFDFVVDSNSANPTSTGTILNDDSMPDGDFNGDGNYDCADIDDLVANVAGQTGDLTYDLSGNGVLDVADVEAWLAIAGGINLPSGNPYLMGDADLNGVVDGSDFIAWNDNKFSSGNGWCGADFNADGSTDGQDFILWNDNKFQASDGLVNLMQQPETVEVERTDQSAVVFAAPPAQTVRALAPLSVHQTTALATHTRATDAAMEDWRDGEEGVEWGVGS